MKSWRLCWLALSVVVLAGCAGPTARRDTFSPTPAQTRLTGLIVQRLEVGRQVAWIKYLNEMPVQDRAREAQVLASLAEQGSRHGLNPAITAEFFTAQIVASRKLQEQLIHKWKRGSTLPAYPPADLRRDIRPRLDRIGEGMLAELQAVSLPDSALSAYAIAQIRQHGFSWAVAREATAPMR